MRYIAAEDVAKAKEMDLLTYLRNYEPQELVHVSGNTYCTREHDSLRISNGKWCWFSQGIGGRSALDYLIKVKGIPFTQAAEIILGREAEKPPVFYRQKERRSTELLMPELSETTEQVEKYLYSRGIHPVIIRYCLDNRLLFESADYHNAVFVGHDKDGKARYGALRSTVSSYKGELTGSDKRFSFFLEGKPNAEQRRNRRTRTFLFPTATPRKRTRRKHSWMRFLPLRPIRRRHKRKTPRKARLRNPVRPSLHQISARKPSGVSLILRNAPAHLSGRK